MFGYEKYLTLLQTTLTFCFFIYHTVWPREIGLAKIDCITNYKISKLFNSISLQSLNHKISSNPVRQSEHFSSLTPINHKMNPSLVRCFIKYFLTQNQIYHKGNPRFFRSNSNGFSKLSCKISHLQACESFW